MSRYPLETQSRWRYYMTIKNVGGVVGGGRGWARGDAAESEFAKP